jgi:N-acetylglucosamine kinase-like BadF-type ATPase
MTLAIDLGKTSCRARLTIGDRVLGEASGTGAPGLADDDGAGLALESIVTALRGLEAEAVASVERIGVGAAGVEAAPAAAHSLVQQLRDRFRVPVALLSDGLAAHVGAFGGAPGSVLIAGTGAVVFSVTDQGVRQIDGNGPLLGDDGSGRWIGQQGLRAVMRAHDGRGDSTTLTNAALHLVTNVRDLPSWVSAAGTPARTLASFAPAVLDAAERGDAVANDVLDRACLLLAESCAAAGASTVCAVGGLTQHPYFLTRLSAELGLIPARGDALSGAALIAGRLDLLHEERTIRG